MTRYAGFPLVMSQQSCKDRHYALKKDVSDRILLYSEHTDALLGVALVIARVKIQRLVTSERIRTEYWSTFMCYGLDCQKEQKAKYDATIAKRVVEKKVCFRLLDPSPSLPPLNRMLIRFLIGHGNMVMQGDAHELYIQSMLQRIASSPTLRRNLRCIRSLYSRSACLYSRRCHALRDAIIIGRRVCIQQFAQTAIP